MFHIRYVDVSTDFMELFAFPMVFYWTSYLLRCNNSLTLMLCFALLGLVQGVHGVNANSVTN